MSEIPPRERERTEQEKWKRRPVCVKLAENFVVEERTPPPAYVEKYGEAKFAVVDKSLDAVMDFYRTRKDAENALEGIWKDACVDDLATRGIEGTVDELCEVFGIERAKAAKKVAEAAEAEGY